MNCNKNFMLFQDLARPDFDWTFLFKPFPYVEKYSHFLRILLTAHDGDELRDWVGWVKSRFRSLLLKVIPLNLVLVFFYIHLTLHSYFLE